MEIYLHNEIDVDGHTELVSQRFQVDVKEKEGSMYLLYQNDESEKVVIKCSENELLMTRFSTPKSVMRFLPNQEAIVTVPTPMGIQHFVTDTKKYLLDSAQQMIHLQYELKGLENQQRFASYNMKISWK